MADAVRGTSLDIDVLDQGDLNLAPPLSGTFSLPLSRSNGHRQTRWTWFYETTRLAIQAHGQPRLVLTIICLIL